MFSSDPDPSREDPYDLPGQRPKFSAWLIEKLHLDIADITDDDIVTAFAYVIAFIVLMDFFIFAVSRS